MIRQSPYRSSFFSENSVSHSKQVNLTSKACPKVTFFAVKTLTVRQRNLSPRKPLTCPRINKAIAMPDVGLPVKPGGNCNKLNELPVSDGIVLWPGYVKRLSALP